MELTKQDILELFAESDRRFAEADRRFAERLAQEAAERKKSQKAFDKRLGEITGTWGRFVQAMVEPNILKLFSRRGLDLTLSVSKVKQEKNGMPFYEIDLLLVNQTDVVAVEIKSTLQVADVDEHLARLEKIRVFPPSRFDLTGVNLFGAVAGMIIAQNADAYAVNQGLYVLKQAGNTIKIVNDGAFVPKAWQVG